MAEVNGKVVSCDRCGANIFLRVTGEGETDGGWTRWNTFEKMPDGWNYVAVPKSTKWTGSGNAYNNYMQACPDCHKLWNKIINEGFLKGTEYYMEEVDG